MVRSYVNQGVQIGVESTSGTAVPGSKQLMAYQINPHIVVETQQHKASGFLVATASSLVSEMTEADYEGPIDYANIVYPLSSIFGAATISQPAAVPSPTVYSWLWDFTGQGGITPKTFSVEVGDMTRAAKFNYGAFTGAELSIERTGDNSISGSMIGRELTTGVTLTSSPTAIDLIPVNGDHWDVYTATTGAGLSSPTQLTAIYEAGLSFTDLLAPEFTLNSSLNSFNSLYTNEDPSFEWNMMLGADATAEGFLTNVRAGTKSFIRLKATGPIIEDALPYSITIDMCVVVTEFDAYESSDGMYVLPLSFALAYDATWGKAMSITIQNTLSAL